MSISPISMQNEEIEKTHNNSPMINSSGNIVSFHPENRFFFVTVIYPA